MKEFVWLTGRVAKAETWRLKPKQRPQSTASLGSFRLVFRYISCIVQAYLLRDDIPHKGLDPPTSIRKKKMSHRYVHGPVQWRKFLS